MADFDHERYTRNEAALLRMIGDLERRMAALEAAVLPSCRHCNKPVYGGGNEHEECRINERELWGPHGRPSFRC